MGAFDPNQFSAQQNLIANICKALAHPARVAIIEHLLKIQACICSDIVDELPLAQSTVSRHLSELKNAGLIKGSIEGNSICYCIDDKTIKLVLEYLSKVSAGLKNNDCC